MAIKDDIDDLKRLKKTAEGLKKYESINCIISRIDKKLKELELENHNHLDTLRKVFVGKHFEFILKNEKVYIEIVDIDNNFVVSSFIIRCKSGLFSYKLSTSDIILNSDRVSLIDNGIIINGTKIREDKYKNLVGIIDELRNILQ